MQFLASLLNTKYDLNTSIQKAGDGNQYTIYIPKHKLNDFITIVRPHIHPSMLHKIARVHGLPFFSRAVAKQRSPEKNGLMKLTKLAFIRLIKICFTRCYVNIKQIHIVLDLKM